MRPCAQSDTARAGTFGLKTAILENKVVYVDMNDCPAQLDILAEDEHGAQFNVEIQRNDEGASVQRARFYCGALDMHFLDTGEKY